MVVLWRLKKCLASRLGPRGWVEVDTVLVGGLAEVGLPAANLG